MFTCSSGCCCRRASCPSCPSCPSCQVLLLDLHIPHQSLFTGEYEIQQSASPLWFLYGLAKKLPSVLIRDILDGVSPVVLSLQQMLE